MITAKEAKELYHKSGATVQMYVERHFANQVVAAANAGKQTYFHVIDAEPVGISLTAPSVFFTLVIQELSNLGYVARWVRDNEPYVPRGLSNNDGTGPLYSNYGIQVGW